MDDAQSSLTLCLPLLQLRKVERDKKTMDQEIVELTNKLLDAKNTIDKLEELNVGGNHCVFKLVDCILGVTELCCVVRLTHELYLAQWMIDWEN